MRSTPPIAFGLRLLWPGDEPVASPDGLVLSPCSAAEIESLWSGASAPALWETRLDDRAFRAWRGRGRDHRFDYGDGASFWLDPSRRVLRWSAADPDDPAWQRVLLDTVLLCVTLLRGNHALHAAAVELPAGVVAIVSASGGGKSSLAAALMARGHALVADDVLVLESTGRLVVAHPGPPLMNLAHSAAALGARELARIGGEAWVEVDAAVQAPRPLAAVCFLERGSGSAPALGAALGATSLHLIAHAPVLVATIAGRARAFELFGDVAGLVPMLRLQTPSATRAEDLAELVEGRFARAEAIA